MKRNFIIIASMLLALSSRADTLSYTSGQDSVRVYDTPCANLAVLARITPRYHADMRKAEADVGGKSFEACWIVDGDHAHLLYEDGDQGMLPLSGFKIQPSA